MKKLCDCDKATPTYPEFRDEAHLPDCGYLKLREKIALELVTTRLCNSFIEAGIDVKIAKERGAEEVKKRWENGTTATDDKQRALYRRDAAIAIDLVLDAVRD